VIPKSSFINFKYIFLIAPLLKHHKDYPFTVNIDRVERMA
jgi:hypothetical protein